MRKRQPRYRPTGDIVDLFNAIIDDFTIEECVEFMFSEGQIDEVTRAIHLQGLGDGTMSHEDYRTAVKAYAATT